MRTCEKIMTRDPVTCRPNDTLSMAADRMRLADVGCLPVVDDDEGWLVGIVAQADLVTRLHDRGLVVEYLEEISEPVEAAYL